MKKILIVLLFLSLSVTVFSQTKEEKAYLDDIVKKDFLTMLPKGAKNKEISFPDNGYIIACNLSKNKPVEGKMIKISDGQNIILEGIYSIVNGQSQVWGRYNYEHDGRPASSYGKFYVSNGADELIMKPRKASALSVKVDELDIWSGYYHDIPCLLNGVGRDAYHLSLTPEDGEWYYSEFNTNIFKSVAISLGYENIEAMLLSGTLNIQMRLDDGWKFSGNAVGRQDEKFGVKFTLLDGKKIKGFQVKEVKKTNGQFPYGYIFRMTYLAFSQISEEILSLPATMEHIVLDSLWSKSYYLAHSPEITIKYTNGNTYSGSFEVSDGIVATTGTYTYKNGDKFIGDLSGAHYGGIPVDGKTIFNDGEEKEGNWLKEYEDELTDSQFTSLYKEHSPSEVRDKAVLLINENYFNKLVAEAEEYERNGNLKAAKNFYQLALARKNSPVVSAKIKAVEDKIYRLELVEKYGSRFADNIINKRIETGMTKEMCELVVNKVIGMDFYRVSTWTNFAGDEMETWEFDYEYGMEKENQRQLKKNLEENKESAVIVYQFMNALGDYMWDTVDNMVEYKYLKFCNSILIELKDSSFYDDMNKAQRDTEDALNSLYWLLGD